MDTETTEVLAKLLHNCLNNYHAKCAPTNSYEPRTWAALSPGDQELFRYLAINSLHYVNQFALNELVQTLHNEISEIVFGGKRLD